MDVHYMAQMMLDCLPKNEQGEMIRIELIRQYQDLKTKGVIYTLRGVKYEQQHHFDLSDLINKIRSYVNTYELMTLESQKAYWGSVVGLAQSKLPAHIRHHYCDPEESLFNSPTFTKQALKRVLTVYNTDTGKNLLWTERIAGLGTTHGLRSRTVGGEPSMRDDPSPLIVAKDQSSLEELARVRMTIDLPALEARLNTSLFVQQMPQFDLG